MDARESKVHDWSDELCEESRTSEEASMQHVAMALYRRTAVYEQMEIAAADEE